VFEKLSAEGFFFHRKCFKCEHCEMTLRLGNYGYVPPEDGQPGRFYCKAHYRKVFYETPGKSPRDKEEKGMIVVFDFFAKYRVYKNVLVRKPFFIRWKPPWCSKFKNFTSLS
jgi:hypothetical protein